MFKQVIRLGPIILSVNTLLVSIFGNLTVIPISLITVQLFRKSKPRKYVDIEDIHGDTSGKKKKWWKRKFLLPWWCIYISWTLSILSSLASAIIVIFYSLQWGKTRSEEWLSSLFLSFFQSVILIQPIKVSGIYFRGHSTGET